MLDEGLQILIKIQAEEDIRRKMCLPKKEFMPLTDEEKNKLKEIFLDSKKLLKFLNGK